MDAIERKARELVRSRGNRYCGTCKHQRNGKCAITADANKCIYNDTEFWQPNTEVFLELAEKVLEHYE